MNSFASLILMMLMGVWLGASFSVYQRFVRPRKKRHWILLFTDPLFWTIQAVLLFSLLLPVNQGRLRLYLILGVALGFSFYKSFLEKFFLYILEGIISAIVRIWRFVAKTVYHLFLYPLYFLLKLVYILCRMTVRIVLKILFFLLIFPMKILRGVLRLFLPEKWRIGIKKRTVQIQRQLMKWVSFLTGRR
jgi:spore cortex biosynthesis protein YabQ